MLDTRFSESDPLQTFRVRPNFRISPPSVSRASHRGEPRSVSVTLCRTLKRTIIMQRRRSIHQGMSAEAIGPSGLQAGSGDAPLSANQAQRFLTERDDQTRVLMGGSV
jgi:hypothetical protein